MNYNLYTEIREKAKQKGYNVSDVERLSGLSKNTIYKWAVSDPSIDKVIRVADFLACSVDELCGRSFPENTVYIEKSSRALNAQYTDEDFTMLQAFHTLSDADRLQVMNLLLRLKFKSGEDDEHGK